MALHELSLGAYSMKNARYAPGRLFVTHNRCVPSLPPLCKGLVARLLLGHYVGAWVLLVIKDGGVFEEHEELTTVSLSYNVS